MIDSSVIEPSNTFKQLVLDSHGILAFIATPLEQKHMIGVLDGQLNHLKVMELELVVARTNEMEGREEKNKKTCSRSCKTTRSE